MRYHYIRNSIVVLVLSLIGFACSDTVSTSPDGGDQATVNGRVESSAGSEKAKTSGNSIASVEGAVVTATKVNADGSLETIGNAEAETNAEGEFTLQVDGQAAANAAENIVIMAEKEGNKWKAYLAQKLESGSSVDLKPITIESTGEANVYQKIVAEGETDAVSKANIEAYIGAEAAAELQSNEEATTDFANALVAEAQTQAEILAHQSADISEEQMASIESAQTEALANLNAELYASTSQSAKAEAHKTFVEAIVKAHADAEVNTNAYAKAKEAATHLVIENASELSNTAQSEVRANASALVAITIDKAVQARLEAESASESTVNAVAQAGADLRADVHTNASATEEEVEGMFDTYNEAVVNALEQEFSASAELLASANSQIGSDTGAKATLESSIEADASTDEVVDAYTSFYNSVSSVIGDVLSIVSDTEAKLFTDVMILVNVAN